MEYVTKLDTGGYMMQKIFLDKIPIFVPSKQQEKDITFLVEKILQADANGKDTGILEKQIDKLVYNLYDFSKEEIKIVEEASNSKKVTDD